MPRCRKILANGKRCKAHAMAGSKFCLFHTPGQKMKRRKKPVAEKSSNSRLQQTGKNQLAVRGSRKAGNMIAGYGAYLQNRPESYIFTKHHSARVNTQGTTYVGAHTQRTVEHYRSEGGRNFRATDGSSKHRAMRGRFLVWGGRLIPLLGYGYVGYSITRGGAHHRSGPLESNRLHDAIGPLALPVTVLADTGYFLGSMAITGASAGASSSARSGGYMML